jgi:hypothetical protein
LREEHRRFEVIQAVRQAIIESRHAGSEVNTAIMLGNTAKRNEARAAQKMAEQVADRELMRLAGFDPVSTKLISDNLRELDEDSLKAIDLLKNHRDKEAGPMVRSVQARLNLVQSTLDNIAARERGQSQRELAAADGRIELSNVVAFAMVTTAFLVGLPLTLMIGRSITHLLAALSAAIQRVNAGDTNFDLPPVTVTSSARLRRRLQKSEMEYRSFGASLSSIR